MNWNAYAMGAPYQWQGGWGQMQQQGQANQINPIPAGGYDGSGINPGGMYTGGNHPAMPYPPAGNPAPPMSGNDPAHASPILYPPMQTGGNGPATGMPPQAQGHAYGRMGTQRPEMPMNGWGRFMQNRPLVN